MVRYEAGPTLTGARTTPAGELASLLRQGRVVVADFPAVALDATSITAMVELLRGRVHAVLAGDSPRNRVQFPPAYRAALIKAAGLRAWAGLSCRDRNRVALEGELAALAHLGVDAVHCVTGDHPALGSRRRRRRPWSAASAPSAPPWSRAGSGTRSAAGGGGR